MAEEYTLWCLEGYVKPRVLEEPKIFDAMVKICSLERKYGCENLWNLEYEREGA